MADGGSLFLDELGETSLNVQVNLLRVLEEMCFRRIGGQETVHVDTRIVAATNANLESKTRDGSFREDLFYRLNVFPIQLPPLRERPEDIGLLTRHFLDDAARDYGIDAPTISPEAMAAITSSGGSCLMICSHSVNGMMRGDNRGGGYACPTMAPHASPIASPTQGARE